MAIVGEAEVEMPWPGGGGYPPNRLAGESSRALYEQLAELSRSTGSLVLEQLNHPGGQVWFEEQRAAFAPSAYPQPRSYTVPVPVDLEQIGAIRSAYVAAARTAWKSGLGGIEVKADQGKLIHQFLSRELNRRSDAYGQGLEGRMRFLREVLMDMRSAAPSPFILGVRLAGHVTPSTPPGDGAMALDITIEETVEVAVRLEAEGLVDYLSVSGESNATVWGYRQSHGDEMVPKLTFASLGKTLKSAVSLPVLLAGRILDLDDADAAIASGSCDAAGMARALIADAELLLHDPVAESRSPARPCISCNLSCIGRTWYGQSVGCIYDPLSGRERIVGERRTGRRSLTLAVVGAGPAGLEFARTAAALGARITIFERTDRIGGRLSLWSSLPGRRRVNLAVDYWQKVMSNSPEISIEYGCEISPDQSLEGFDHVVRATGARAVIPLFAETKCVDNLTIEAALGRDDWLGCKVVLVDGDRHSDPLGVALYLARQGASILLVTPYDTVGVGLDPVSRASRLEELARLEVTYALWSDVRFSPTDGILVLYDHCANLTRRLEQVQRVVWCVNPLPDQRDWKGGPTRVIGDARWPRGLDVATKEAFDLAYYLHSEAGDLQ
jgi:2,4-dienoyl-CoA reductase-like NADH-dependent reductase (Old Yellow Enzyme family)